MGRSVHVGLLTLAAALLVLAGCRPGDMAAAAQGWAAATGVQMARLPDGRRLALRCSGHGSPTVLLEAGYAGSSLGWSKTQAMVAPTTRVCSYDRAGYGLSDPGPAPRDGAATARDLDQALKAAGISGPFVLVGHSAGGIYVRLFAARRPKDVVGMVLVDPSIEHQDRRFAAVFGPGAGSLDSQKAKAARCLRATQMVGVTAQNPEFTGCFSKNGDPLPPASVWRTQMSEADTLWGSTSDEADRIGGLLQDIPIIVLTAQNSYPSGNSAHNPAQRLWEQLHREIASRFFDAQVRDVASSHMMMIERPEVVSAAVLEMVARARATKTPRG